MNNDNELKDSVQSTSNDENNTFIRINATKMANIIDNLLMLEDLEKVKTEINKLKEAILCRENYLHIFDFSNINDQISDLKLKYLIEDLEQIESVRTLERGRYYLKRMKNYLLYEKTAKINDINLNRWKEYDEIITDSLWIIDKRDSSGAHLAWYWGNFIPQIPHQLMLRYTKKGDWVLDPFVGSGTTLIECRRLGRNGIGIELNRQTAEKAKELVEQEPNEFGVSTEIIVGDSSMIDLSEILKQKGIEKVQMVIMHPPYHDIIKFSNDPHDLSNAPSVNGFLEMFGRVFDNVAPVLESNRYLAIVIGDKYSKGEWIPLGFYVMNEVMKHKNFILKSIIVKNFEETRGKREQKELWRYRALAGGFYVFKHEYILIFVKR